MLLSPRSHRAMADLLSAALLLLALLGLPCLLRLGCTGP